MPAISDLKSRVSWYLQGGCRALLFVGNQAFPCACESQLSHFPVLSSSFPSESILPPPWWCAGVEMLHTSDRQGFVVSRTYTLK